MTNYQQWLNIYRNLDKNKFINLAELNLYETYPTQIPQRTSGHKGMDIHRCHLVEDFLNLYNLNIDKQLVGCLPGVRSSIGHMMQHYSDKQWLIPADQYPFYETIAQKMLTKPAVSFTSEKEPILTDADVLLTTYPIKPTTWVDKITWQNKLQDWVNAKAERILVLDCVYLFELSDTWLWEMFNSINTIITYSLSKAYSAPLKAGFVFTHDNLLRNRFKAQPMWDGFTDAYVLLNQTPGRKNELVNILNVQYDKTNQIINLAEKNKHNPSYLFHFPELNYQKLAHEKILTIPASIYGNNKPGVVVSTLAV